MSQGGPGAVTVGDPGSLDPGELVVEERGNRVEARGIDRPGPAVRVRAAVVNGKAMKDGR
jgi:hypothetical protein